MSDSINILLVAKAFESVLFSIEENTSITVSVLICGCFFSYCGEFLNYEL